MRDDFWGWYFKCQSDSGTLAVIPAAHRGAGERSCSVQLITGDGSWSVPYPWRAFVKEGRRCRIGENRFGPQGLTLRLRTPELRAEGELRFGALSPIRYDIMGPFALIPGLECRHSVVSMYHPVYGKVSVNGKDYLFQHGAGYWEGDRGRSFPRVYAWTQCHFEGGSLMLSAAEIPLGCRRFTGVIAVVWWRGREYRLATYLGASVKIGAGELVVRQGRDELYARLLERDAKPLRAPVGGAMERTIHESAACRAYYKFRRDGKTLFAFYSDRAAFEYEYPW